MWVTGHGAQLLHFPSPVSGPKPVCFPVWGGPQGLPTGANIGQSVEMVPPPGASSPVPTDAQGLWTEPLAAGPS